jgi:hypothetical protein
LVKLSISSFREPVEPGGSHDHEDNGHFEIQRNL